MQDVNRDGKITISDYTEGWSMAFQRLSDWFSMDANQMTEWVANSSFGVFFEITQDGAVASIISGIYSLFSLISEYILGPLFALIAFLLLSYFILAIVFPIVVKNIKNTPKQFTSFKLKNLVFQTGFISIVIFLTIVINTLIIDGKANDAILNIQILGIAIFFPIYLLLLFTDSIVDVIKEWKENKNK